MDETTLTDPLELPKIPRYDVLEFLGEGATALVFRARDTELGRPVAVKVLRDSAGLSLAARERFRREGQAMAGMDHPGVVSVHDAGEVDGQLFLVMEFVEGQDLDQLLEQTGCLASDRAMGLMSRIAAAVSHAHDQGIVHRDLKPSNILIGADGEPRVADFGLALPLGEERMTMSGVLLGTPCYMAPEQFACGELDVRTDVYALGVILYKMLSNRLPFQAPTREALMAKVAGEDPLRLRLLEPSTPIDLEAICLKALEKEPAHRYASVAELSDDLARFASGQAIRARRMGLLRRAGRSVRRHWPVVVPAGVLAAMLATLGVVHLAGKLEQAREREASNRKLRASLTKEKQLNKALTKAIGQRDLALVEKERQARIRGAYDAVRQAVEHHHVRGGIPEVNRLLRDAERLAPGYARALFTRGRIAIEKERWTEAWHLLDQAREGMPDDPMLHWGLYSWYAHYGRETDAAAIEHVRVIARRDKDSSLGWWARAHLDLLAALPEVGKRRTELLARAGGHCQRSLERRRGFYPALICRARIMIAAGGFAEVRDKLRPVLRLYAGPEVMELEGAVMLGLLRLPEAVRAFDRAIALNPDLATAFRGRALCRLALREDDRAMSDLGAAIRIAPRSPQPYLDRAAVHAGHERHRQALADLDRAVAVDPWPFRSLTQRGLHRLKRGQPREAIVDLDRALADNEDHWPAIGARGVALYLVDRFGEAVRDLERALPHVEQAGRRKLIERYLKLARDRSR